VVFEALATNYSDQTSIVEKVKPLLDELSNPDPAMLMPPNTLLYWETGSPGKQIETILNMLKGTPFENPLAVIGGGRGQGAKSPSDIFAALMNPSMMAEFKKIRGMAVGVTGIAQSNPPSIVVLYPGKSDALRGIILAGLGMVAQPGDPIEGMQTLRLGEGGVAHDDRVIIIAQPLEQLTWCIRQYKGITKAPAFAANNKSFAKIGRQARQDSAITIWANVDEVYKSILQMVPSDDLPSELKIAQQVGDFENIDDVLVTMGLRQQGLAMDATVSFKAGHSCMVYDLIRSPNLTGSGFKTLPPQAVAIASFALGDADSSGVAQAQKTVKRLTGLDIGREIFANIEQVTLFALPPQTSTGGADVAVPAPYCLGLALTSRNPEQTRQLCHQLLGIVDTLANSWANKSPNAKSDPTAGKFLIPIPNQEVYVHVKQAGKATVIAFSPNVLEASLAAANKAGAPTTASPLAEPLGNLSGSTSKLVLVNLGGAIRIFDSHIDFEHKNPQNPAHKLMGQLAQACEKTYVQLRTDEAVDNFSVHVSVNQLPPLDAVFPLLMQLMNTDLTAQAVATKPSPADGATISPTQELKVNFRVGVNAKSHNVYFGATADSLTMQTQVANKPDMKVLPMNVTVSSPAQIKLPGLEEGKTYYWRVDEVWQDGTVITGQTWKFTVGKLVAHWKLDESEGSVAKDSAGNNNGTLVGNPKWQPSGKVGGALHFDGDGDCVEVSNESAFDITGLLTVAAWIKVTQFDKGWQAIVTKGDSTWRIQRRQQTDSLEFACSGLQMADGNQWGNLNGEKSINDGQWHHAAGVYDGQKMSLYVDGKLDVSVKAWGSLNADDFSVVIGENSQARMLQGRSWNGLIDDVRIYDYALSEKEIAALASPQ